VILLSAPLTPVSPGVLLWEGKDCHGSDELESLLIVLKLTGVYCGQERLSEAEVESVD